jgi:protein TonB
MTVPAAPDLGSVGVPYGSNQRASGNGVWHGAGSGFDVAAPPPPPSVARQPRVSRIMEGNLIYRVQPDYPSLARLARIQGAVVLRAVISKQGTIENLQAISGPPMLMKAAVDAVQRWRYRPYLLNGEPVEVDTEITVNFVLGGG